LCLIQVRLNDTSEAGDYMQSWRLQVRLMAANETEGCK
jgi:hypothetical protein